MAEPNVERLKAQRAGHRGFATKIENEVRGIMENNNADGLPRIEELSEILKKRIEMITNLDGRVVNVVDVEDIEQEIMESSELEQRLRRVIGDIKRFVISVSKENVPKPQEINEDQPPPAAVSVQMPIENASAEVSPSNSTIRVESNAAPKVRLPKLTLPRFKGEVTSFASFWDMFHGSIHTNTSLRYLL